MLFLKNFWKITSLVLAGMMSLSIGWVFIYKWMNPSYTYLMLKREREAKVVGVVYETKKKWVPYKEIPHHTALAVIYAEDIPFFTHRGVIFKNMWHAAKLYVERGFDPKNGFSTISQQTAKNAFLYPSRTLLRKGLEFYFTLLIELVWGKERILEVYLNIAEWGIGVFGIEAAAEEYFHKSCQNLNIEESCRLASILINPREIRADIFSEYLEQRSRELYHQVDKRLKLDQRILKRKMHVCL